MRYIKVGMGGRTTGHWHLVNPHGDRTFCGLPTHMARADRIEANPLPSDAVCSMCRKQEMRQTPTDLSSRKKGRS